MRKVLKFTSFLLVILLVACSSTSTTNYKWNLSSIYNPLKTTLHPSYKVFHNTDNTSVLFFKIRTSELFFRPDLDGSKELCSFKIDYKLQQVRKDSNSIVDSNTFIYEFDKVSLSNYYITQIPIKAAEGGSYRLKVTIRDNYRKSYNISYIDIEKIKDKGEQYFNLTTLNGTPIFKNVVINDGAFRVNHASPTSNKLYISYYKNRIEAPQPDRPAKSDSILYKRPDSLYIVNYDPNGAISLSWEGMYFFQFDTTSNEGLSINKLNSDFPKVSEPNGLIPPITYLTTKAEYNKLTGEGNPKLLADNFWIKCGGNTDRGRELIRIFYNRVYFANYYFTNTKEGWKTDRGMVYVVFGPPHIIEKSADKEIWKYNHKGESTPTSFTFFYKPNKFGINKYSLSRANSHEWGWTEAIYAWTSGDIFLFD